MHAKYDNTSVSGIMRYNSLNIYDASKSLPNYGKEVVVVYVMSWRKILQLILSHAKSSALIIIIRCSN